MKIKKDFNVSKTTFSKEAPLCSDELLSFDALNPINHGTYYIVTCPRCGHHEAFVFKDDVIAAQKDPKKKIRYRCNRQNHCGASGWLNLNSQSIQKLEVKVDDSTGISAETLKRFQALYEYGHVKSFDFSVRGISNNVLKQNKVMYWPYGFQDFLYTSGGEKSDRFKGPAYLNRDIMFPIVDKNGNLQRLLLRSSGNPVKKSNYIILPKASKKSKKNLKEIQIRMVNRPKTEVFNLKDVYDPEIKFLVVCEGAYDALSIKEAAYQNHINDVGAIGVPGCRKFKKTIQELNKLPEMKGKTFVIASDNDEAGKEARNECAKIARKEKINILFYNLHTSNDLNEFLTKRRNWFINDFRVQRKHWMNMNMHK